MNRKFILLALVIALISGCVTEEIERASTTTTTVPSSGCRGFSQVVPLDSKLSGNKLQIVISNEAGTKLRIDKISATIGSDSCSSTFSEEMIPGRIAELNLTFSSTYTSGEYYRANIVIEYENLVSKINHKSSGNCWGTVE